MQVLIGWGEDAESPGLRKAIEVRKNELIENADGRPRGNAAYTQQDGPVFGDGTTSAQAEGGGGPVGGQGEAPDAITAPAPVAPQAPAPVAPQAPETPAPAPANESDEWTE